MALDPGMSDLDRDRMWDDLLHRLAALEQRVRELEKFMIETDPTLAGESRESRR